MKTKISIILILLGISFSSFAQSILTYSLARPTGGGNLQLVEFDLITGTQTTVKAYLTTELEDYNSEATCFDYQNSRFITVGNALSQNDKIIAINTSNGNIDYSYSPISIEVGSIEFSNGTIYSLARPTGGGNLQLVEFDIISGTQTTIKTYLTTELEDYNPEATCFDYQNSRFIIVGNALSQNDKIIAINTTNGNIDYSYSPISIEVGSIEFSNGAFYSLARPTGGGNLQLVEFDIVLGTQSTIKSYLTTELEDYNPEATCFDYQNLFFITVGNALSQNEKVISINTSNGNIDYSYSLMSIEAFSIESPESPNLIKKVENIISLILYPNPSKDYIVIESNFNYDRLEIINSLGELLFETKKKCNNIHISSLLPGIYWVRLSKMNTSIIKPLIKY